MSQEALKYRVIDKFGTVFGSDLTEPEAKALRQRLFNERKTRSAGVEPMPVESPDTTPADVEVTSAPVPVGARYDLEASGVDTRIPDDGVIVKVQSGHALLVNGVTMPVPTTVKAGDIVHALAVDPDILAAQARARAAVAPIVERQQRPAYKDKTVRPPAPRRGPPPPDKTVSKDHVIIRLGAPPSTPPKPLPSPLKVALQTDGNPLPDNAIGEEDLPDLSAGIGGLESPEDVDHAKRQRDAERG